jgi:hypothetical protein
MAQFDYKEIVVSTRAIANSNNDDVIYTGTWGQVLGGDYRADSDDYRVVFVEFFTEHGLITWSVTPDAITHAPNVHDYDVRRDKEIDFRA